MLIDPNLWRKSRKPVLNVDMSNVPSRGIYVLAEGTVVFEDAEHVEDTWVIPASWIPFYIPVYTTKIKTGTTVAVANLRICQS